MDQVKPEQILFSIFIVSDITTHNGDLGGGMSSAMCSLNEVVTNAVRVIFLHIVAIHAGLGAN